MHHGQFVVVFRDEFRVEGVDYLTAEARKHRHLPIAHADRGEKALFAKPPSNYPSAYHQILRDRRSTCGRSDDPAADFQAVILRELHFLQARFELTPRNQTSQGALEVFGKRPDAYVPDQITT
jgi:hypothetical protein